MSKLSTEEAIKILEDMKIDIPLPKAAVTQIKRNIALDMAVDALSNCSEFPNNWIPCSERLPENYERVLATISISNREPKVRSGYYHNGLFSNDNGDCWNSTDPEVKGWCKLPEPYKPESEGQYDT